MDNLNDYTEHRPPEFQIVIIIDNEDGGIFPLTSDDCPKCLLPICNRKLLSYQLDLVAKSGGVEVYLVAPDEYEAQLAHFLADYARENMKIELVTVEEMNGSADGLRAVSDRIRGDFICLSSDFICQYTLGDIVNLHRLKTSDLTMMFTTVGKETKKDEMTKEYVGITEEGRVVFKSPALEIDETVGVSKPLLHRTPTLSMRSNLMDMGVYVMSHWVIEFVKSNHKITSIRTDLVPHFINRQFQPASYLYEVMPALEHRRRPLHDLESWLVAPDRAVHAIELIDQVLANMHVKEQPVTPSKNREVLNSDLLRCFGLVYDARAANTSVSSTGAPGAVAASSAVMLTRITNITSYMVANRDFPLHSFDARSPWKRFTGFQKKETSVVGDNTDLNPTRNVTYKQCSIGSNCVIGQGCKLNNCVIMDNVAIGDNCTIQNCVISEKAVIESNCNLNECHVGYGYKMTQGTKQKGELFASN